MPGEGGCILGIVYSYLCKYFLLTIKQLLQAFVYARKPELQFPDKRGPAVIMVCHDLTLFISL